jgi:branched-chain amino acid transport system permease protein
LVLLGGLDTLTGPVVGAAIFTWLRDTLARETEFWRAVLGLVILLIVLIFPQGLVGGLKALSRGGGRHERHGSGRARASGRGPAQGVRRCAGRGRRLLRGERGRDCWP